MSHKMQLRITGVLPRGAVSPDGSLLTKVQLTIVAALPSVAVKMPPPPLMALPELPTSEAPSGAEDAVDDGLSVPSPQYTPAPEPDPPAATVWPEPAPEPVPTPEIVLQPEPEPEPLAPEPKAERGATGSDADERPRKHRDKDGGPSPGRIRKGAKK